MILQSSHVVVDCPICGRPLEMKSNSVGQKVHCGHCHGGLIVYKTANGSLKSMNSNGNDSLRRAEQLLRAANRTGASASCHCNRQNVQQLSDFADKKRRGNLHCTSPQAKPCKGESQPTILLVEHRDEVFARLATDIAEFGFRVIRAKSAIETMKLYDKHKPTLIVGNVDLPDQSGWLMTAKLRLSDRGIRVWLYQRQPSNYGQEIAEFLKVDALLPYRGDLLSLSEQVINLMADLMAQRSKSTDSEDGFDKSEESAAA